MMQQLVSRWSEGGEDLIHFDVSFFLSFVLGPLIMILGFIFKAPYGKFNSKSIWSYAVNKKLAWVLMESPALVLVLVNYLLLSDEAHFSCITYRISFLMFAGHYFNRTLVYPFSLKDGKFNFLTLILGFMYNLVNGTLQGRFLARLGPVSEELNEFSLRIAFGMIVFCLGAFINWHADLLLERLRKPGETRYKIPYGGIFNFVTAGNYCGELIEWIGYAITLNGRAGWVFVSLCIYYFAPRAHMTQLWYLSKFEDYPKNRKRLIPLIW